MTPVQAISLFLNIGMPLIQSHFQREAQETLYKRLKAKYNQALNQYLSYHRQNIEREAIRRYNEERSGYVWELFQQYFFKYILLFLVFVLILFLLIKKK